jgi:hypothetical protein
MGWRNTSFRGYADYMQTPEFEKSLEELIELANHDQLALMCAEAVPWRCHRSLIGDALLARGIQVEDIMSLIRAPAHTLTSFAEVRGRRVTYPLEPPLTRKYPMDGATPSWLWRCRARFPIIMVKSKDSSGYGRVSTMPARTSIHLASATSQHFPPRVGVIHGSGCGAGTTGSPARRVGENHDK